MIPHGPSIVARRHGPSRLGAVVLAAAALAANLVLVAPGVAAAPELIVQAGVGDGTVAGQAFMPGDVTVAVGDSVTWRIGSDEPHTITFGDGPAGMPPDAWPVAGFTPPDPGSPPPMDIGTATYDGTGFLNTSFLVGMGSQATVAFTTAGAFPYVCAIHPGMAGTVTVVESGDVTTQQEADVAAAATSGFLLGQVDSLRQERLGSTTETDNDDGTTTWNVFVDAATNVGPMPGGGTGLLELLEFSPPAAEIGVGDTVRWTASRTHTVTFVPPSVDPTSVFADFPAYIAPMGGPTYDGTQPVNSGFLNFGPGSPSQFAITFTAEGVFPFYCGLHALLGQIGTLAVGVPLPSAPTGPPMEPAPTGAP
jgi:plastocyanin